ncbi:hypothetical protein GMRT_11635 [Giardia muris]|uniref:Uncharacterized protein n=1 Tax=Giardia muris TaxID=5742 RepID=A0A4Z1TAM7_GIAMU|nr:hypothetical protein GMRT_11635 [Giardia muris]|eukprot:TNJ29571.1 hypothetical protein GMRT_11635 [Giardia muris]
MTQDELLDNLGVIIQSLTPHASITTAPTVEAPTVHLSSIWRFFDAPYGHPTFLQCADGSVVRRYWKPTLSALHLEVEPSPDLDSPLPPRFSTLTYCETLPISERMPLIDTIKHLARVHPILSEATVRDLRSTSWISVVWTQIGMDPRLNTLQRGSLLMFYKIASPQVLGWMSRHPSEKTVQQVVSFSYTRFYCEAMRKGLFSPYTLEMYNAQQPSKFPFKQLASQEELRRLDREYVYYCSQTSQLPTFSSDFNWAHRGFFPDRTFSHMTTLTRVRATSQYTGRRRPSFRGEEGDVKPMASLGVHTLTAHPVTSDIPSSGRVIDRRGMTHSFRCREAFYCHHILHEPAPSAISQLDAYLYFVQHISMRNGFQLYDSEVILSPSSDPVSRHVEGSLGGETATDSMFGRSWDLSVPPASLEDLFYILHCLGSATPRVFRELPVYYRVLLNVLYFNNLHKSVKRAFRTDEAGSTVESGNDEQERPADTPGTLPNYVVKIHPPYTVASLRYNDDPQYFHRLRELTLKDLRHAISSLLSLFFGNEPYFHRLLSKKRLSECTINYLSTSRHFSSLRDGSQPNHHVILTHPVFEQCSNAAGLLISTYEELHAWSELVGSLPSSSSKDHDDSGVSSESEPVCTPIREKFVSGTSNKFLLDFVMDLLLDLEDGDGKSVPASINATPMTMFVPTSEESDDAHNYFVFDDNRHHPNSVTNPIRKVYHNFVVHLWRNFMHRVMHSPVIYLTFYRRRSSLYRHIYSRDPGMSAVSAIVGGVAERFVSDQKIYERLLTYQNEHNISDFTDIASTAIGFLTSRTLVNSVRLSFLGCVPLDVLRLNLDFLSLTDNSPARIADLLRKSEPLIVKGQDYDPIYHVFLKIILEHVQPYNDLTALFPQQREWVAVASIRQTAPLRFMDTVDDSALPVKTDEQKNDAARRRASSVTTRESARGLGGTRSQK